LGKDTLKIKSTFPSRCFFAMQTYKYLTIEQRVEIALYHREGKGSSEIGRLIGKDKSVISRELKRNSSPGSYQLYNGIQAHKRFEQRSKNKGRKAKLDAEMKNIIRQKMALKWSPEQIVGRCKKDGIEMASHETIYLYIYENKKNGGVLFESLRHSHRTRRKRSNKNKTRGQISDRVSISERPEIVEKRERIGDWEGDTIVGKDHKSAVATMVDRVSSMTLIVPLADKTAAETAKQIIEEMKQIDLPIFTITFDNGKEFSEHKTIANQLKTKVFFADPYSSFQRGTNENTNGLIRQYFPKKTDFKTVSKEELKQAQDELNNRPRKKLGFLTPIEYFRQSVAFKT
jgi:IS30 family transposase